MSGYVIAAIITTAERNNQERARLRYIRDTSNPFEVADVKFQKMFRLPKAKVITLIESLPSQLLGVGRLPKYLKILAALQFYSQGSYQFAVGLDSNISLSQPAVSRAIKVVSNAIVVHLTPSIIKFPTTEAEKEAAKSDFLELYGMPNTLGAVDGTHIAIAKPPLNHPTAPGNIFYNRKGFYSINCQIVCSAKGKIISLNPNFPGATHDAAIWRDSQIHKFLRQEFVQGETQQWLLGDKGYPLQPWLMTPLLESSNDAENAYNLCHKRARNIVELLNGRLKNKFRCLHRHRTLHYKPENAAKIILSCCTLYNMHLDDANEFDEINAEAEEVNEIDSNIHVHQDYLNEARHIRSVLINTQFL